jgi:ABC-type sugar transport system ATPase subunit
VHVLLQHSDKSSARYVGRPADVRSGERLYLVKLPKARWKRWRWPIASLCCERAISYRWDAPDKLYSEPGSAFVHEFLGESVRMDCTVSDNFLQIEGLQDVAFVTDCPPGPAIALIRPHEVELSPGPGPARVESVHVNGPMHRLRIVVGGQVLEVLRPEDAWIPIAGQTCNLNLSRARIYPRTN